MHQENQEVLERQAPKALRGVWVYRALQDHEEKLVQRVLLVQKGLLVKTASSVIGETKGTLVQRGCQVLGDLPELRGPLDLPVAREKEAPMGTEDPPDPLELMESEAKWDPKDHRERRAQKESQERGVRRGTEVSLVFMDYLDQLVNLEMTVPEELLDLLDPGAPQESLDPRGKRETWVSLVLWVPLEAEGHQEISVSRVLQVSQDLQAPLGPLAHRHQLSMTCMGLPWTTKGQRVWLQQRRTWRVL